MPVVFAVRGPVPLTSFTPTSTESSNFIARTTGLSNTDKTNYDTLITGLVGDGVWAVLDALYVYAAPDTTTAVLNLLSSSFACIANGSPSFTAYRGYTGVDASTTVYLDTQFNPITAPTPKFTQNSQHMSAWSNTNAAASASGGCIMGMDDGDGQMGLFPRNSDNNSYYVPNGALVTSGTTSQGRGHFTGNRSASNAAQGYRDGSSDGTSAAASGGNRNRNMYVIAFNNVGSVSSGFGGQCCSASIGGSLNSTLAAALYNRLRTYMTAVGVP